MYMAFNEEGSKWIEVSLELKTNFFSESLKNDLRDLIKLLSFEDILHNSLMSL